MIVNNNLIVFVQLDVHYIGLYKTHLWSFFMFYTMMSMALQATKAPFRIIRIFEIEFWFIIIYYYYYYHFTKLSFVWSRSACLTIYLQYKEYPETNGAMSGESRVWQLTGILCFYLHSVVCISSFASSRTVNDLLNDSPFALLRVRSLFTKNKSDTKLKIM